MALLETSKTVGLSRTQPKSWFHLWKMDTQLWRSVALARSCCMDCFETRRVQLSRGLRAKVALLRVSKDIESPKTRCKFISHLQSAGRTLIEGITFVNLLIFMVCFNSFTCVLARAILRTWHWLYPEKLSDYCELKVTYVYNFWLSRPKHFLRSDDLSLLCSIFSFKIIRVHIFRGCPAKAAPGEFSKPFGPSQIQWKCFLPFWLLRDTNFWEARL